VDCQSAWRWPCESEGKAVSRNLWGEESRCQAEVDDQKEIESDEENAKVVMEKDLPEPFAAVVGDIDKDPSPDDVPDDILARAVATTFPGIWLLQIRGNLKDRIWLLGSEQIEGLSENQRRLNAAARMLQSLEISDEMRQGPLGRPVLFNGAFVYVTKLHACCLSSLLRAHGFERAHIQSKHIIVSDELLADVTISLSAQPEGTGRAAFQRRRAGEVSLAVWMPEEEEGDEAQVVLENVREENVYPQSASRDGVRWPFWRRHPSVRAPLNKLAEVIEETERLLVCYRLITPKVLEGFRRELLDSRNPEKLMKRLKVVGDSTFDKWWSRDYDENVQLYNQNVMLNKALHKCLAEMQKALCGFSLQEECELGLGEKKTVPILKIIKPRPSHLGGPIRYHDDPRPPRTLARPVEAISNWQPTLLSQRIQLSKSSASYTVREPTNGSEISSGRVWQ